MAIENLTNKTGENSMEYAVGMAVWFEPDQSLCEVSARYVEVKSVGEDWVGIVSPDNWCIQRRTSSVQSPLYGLVGEVFRSRDECESIKQDRKNRARILTRLGPGSWRSPISRLSTESLQAIEVMLKAENLIFLNPMQSNLTIIELAKETKAIASALLEKLEHFPREYTPVVVLCAIASSGIQRDQALFWEELIDRPGDLASEDRDRLLAGRQKLRDGNLAIEAETQAVLGQRGITDDRTAIEWLEKIAPKIDRDVDRLNETIERHEAELAAFFEDASEWES
jgi:hypothetical protein